MGFAGLSRKAYINKVLQRNSMHAYISTEVLIMKGDKISKDQYPINDIEKESMMDVPYRSALDNLMYA